jgi:hypothetical protein
MSILGILPRSCPPDRNDPPVDVVPDGLLVPLSGHLHGRVKVEHVVADVEVDLLLVLVLPHAHEHVRVGVEDGPVLHQELVGGALPGVGLPLGPRQDHRPGRLAHLVPGGRPPPGHGVHGVAEVLPVGLLVVLPGEVAAGLGRLRGPDFLAGQPLLEGQRGVGEREDRCHFVHPSRSASSRAIGVGSGLNVQSVNISAYASIIEV